MASTYIYRDLGTPTNAYKGTVSHWIKKSIIGANNSEYGTFAAWLNGGSNTRSMLNIYNNTIYLYAQSSSGTVMVLQTNRVFRDPNAWYHIVVAWDTTQSTASNRVKIYVNGVQETSFSTETYPAQNTVLQFNTSGRRFGVGTLANGSGNTYSYWDGLISHFHFIDGTQYAASDFGSTDSTTGEWKINTSPSVTYGNNGFFWLKDNIATTDNSPNSNTFTVGGGTLTKTEDCPDNIFATANPLTNLNGSATYSQGNLKVTGDAAANAVWQTTLGVSSGKWYWELKNLISDSDMSILFYDQSTISGSHPGYGFVCSTRKKIINGSVTGSAIGSAAQNDIWSVALDLDNGKMFIARNGTYLESGNPSTGANPFIQTSDGLPSEGVFGGHAYNGSVELNFGNGYFGTTAVASAGTNASGIGIFEYDVPTGYTALSTKGLNL